MRKLDLKNYTISLPDEKGVLRFTPYQFQNTLMDMLPHPRLGLNGPELLKAMEVVEEIEKAKTEVLLSEEHYQLILDTCKKFRGFTKYDTQFLKRIFNCPVVPDEDKGVDLSDNGKEKK